MAREPGIEESTYWHAHACGAYGIAAAGRLSALAIARACISIAGHPHISLTLPLEAAPCCPRCCSCACRAAPVSCSLRCASAWTCTCGSPNHQRGHQPSSMWPMVSDRAAKGWEIGSAGAGWVRWGRLGPLGPSWAKAIPLTPVTQTAGACHKWQCPALLLHTLCMHNAVICTAWKDHSRRHWPQPIFNSLAHVPLPVPPCSAHHG